jgi:hypothetical protein
VEIFSAFVQEFRNWESAWALEALFVIVYEIRVLAEKVCFLLIKLNFFVTVWLRLFSAQNCKLLSKSFFSGVNPRVPTGRTPSNPVFGPKVSNIWPF